MKPILQENSQACMLRNKARCCARVNSECTVIEHDHECRLVYMSSVFLLFFFHFRYTPTVTALTSPTFVFRGRTPHTFPRALAAASHNGRRVLRETLSYSRTRKLRCGGRDACFPRATKQLRARDRQEKQNEREQI